MRAAIYCRISADPDGTRLGVDRQLADCKALADKLGWTVVHEFSDNDISAYAGRTRPGYEALLAAVGRGEVQGILSWHVDRLHRNLTELERFITLCEAHSVTVQTCQAGTLDLSSASGQMVARIVGAVARHEVDHARSRMKRAHAAHAEAGRWRVGQRAFGWEPGGTELRETEAEAIRQGARMILSGDSLRAVVRDWTARELTTAQGKPWTPLAVRRILTNPRMAGVSIHLGKVVGRGKWPSILDDDTHRALVAVLTDPERSTNHVGAERKYQGSGIYLCGRCGSTVRSFSVAGGAKAYRCNAEPHLSRRQIEVDEHVSDIVIGRLTMPDAALILESGPHVDVPALRTQRDGLQTRLGELADLFAAGHIDATQLRRGSERLREQVEGIDRTIATTRESSPLADLVLAGEELAELWPGLSPEVRGQIIDQLMVVTILPSPRGRRGFDPEFVQIEWKNLS